MVLNWIGLVVAMILTALALVPAAFVVVGLWLQVDGPYLSQCLRTAVTGMGAAAVCWFWWAPAVVLPVRLWALASLAAYVIAAGGALAAMRHAAFDQFNICNSVDARRQDLHVEVVAEDGSGV